MPDLIGRMLDGYQNGLELRHKKVATFFKAQDIPGCCWMTITLAQRASASTAPPRAQ